MPCADLYARLRESAPVPYNLYLDAGGWQLVGATPETFLRVGADGRCETRPIKGTRPRDDDPALDAALAADLATHPKDRAENVMIVDLSRNDLSRVCLPGTVRVPSLCAVESHPTVHQLVSSPRRPSGADPLQFPMRAFGGEDNDVILGVPAPDQPFGEAGDDVLVIMNRRAVLAGGNGGAGNDLLLINSVPPAGTFVMNVTNTDIEAIEGSDFRERIDNTGFTDTSTANDDGEVFVVVDGNGGDDTIVSGPTTAGADSRSSRSSTAGPAWTRSTTRPPTPR